MNGFGFYMKCFRANLDSFNTYKFNERNSRYAAWEGQRRVSLVLPVLRYYLAL